MKNEPEEKKEQPQIIVINIKDQVKTLIKAGELAKEAKRYKREKHGTFIFINDGKNQAPANPTLSEYLKRAEKAIIEEMMESIIQKAELMINEELDQIRECLK